MFTINQIDFLLPCICFVEVSQTHHRLECRILVSTSCVHLSRLSTIGEAHTNVEAICEAYPVYGLLICFQYLAEEPVKSALSRNQRVRKIQN